MPCAGGTREGRTHDAVLELRQARRGNLAPLCKRLRHGRPKGRAAAARALGWLANSRCVPDLCDALGDGHPKVRKAAATALGRIRDTRAVESLCAALTESDDGVLEEVVEAIYYTALRVRAKSGSRAYPHSPLGYRDRVWSRADRQRPVVAAECSSQQLDSVTTEPATQLPGHDALPLGVQSDAAAIPQHSSNAEEGDDGLHATALFAATVEPLCALLCRPAQAVRRAAANALSMIGAPRAFEALCRALTDEDELVRAWATDGIGALRDPRAFEALCRALADESSYVRAYAAEGLGELRDARGVPWLCEALSDEYGDVRGNAAAALEDIGDARAVDSLRLAFKNEYSFVLRATFARALQSLGAGSVPPVELVRLACQNCRREWHLGQDVWVVEVGSVPLLRFYPETPRPPEDLLTAIRPDGRLAREQDMAITAILLSLRDLPRLRLWRCPGCGSSEYYV